MTPRQLRFVEEYRVLRNGKQAALRAGYSESCAEAMASRSLRNPAVVEALRAHGVEVEFASPGRGLPPQIIRPLTARQERFVEQYLIHGNATEAARRAGYSPRSARSLAGVVMNRPQIVEALRVANEARAERTAITADRVLAEFARIAFAEIGRFAEFGPEGVTLKPDSTLGPDDRAAVAELFASPGKRGVTTRVRLFDKQRALENLAKHLGLNRPRPAPPPEPPMSREELDKIKRRIIDRAKEELLAEARKMREEQEAQAAAKAEGSVEPPPPAGIAAPK